MARRKNNAASEEPLRVAGAVPARGFPPRWFIVVLGFLLCAGVMAAIAGSRVGAVFGTYVYAAFVVPVVAAGGILGLRMTEPFVKRGLFEHSPWPAGFRLVMAVALGLGTMALAMLALGTLHLVEPGWAGGGAVWIPMVIPIASAAAGWGAMRRFIAGLEWSVLTARAHRGEWLTLLAAVPVAVLLIAATFPPGTLWNSEARGYDVMEYHLELPREYALNNSTAPLGHNVYSYLPGNVEMLYLMEMQLAKGLMGAERETGYVWGTYPAQFLHALLMLLTAAALALVPVGATKEMPWLYATGRAIAVLLFLGVPWTLVTGSLAYNEAGMLLFGTLALGLALDGSAVTGRSAGAVLIGLLLGLAVGCKMTAGVFFALPVAAIYLVRAATDSAQLRALLTAGAVAGAVYLPWAVRAAVYSGGNPVFPIAATVWARDGWTAEQSQRWAAGHAAQKALQAPAARLWMLGQKSALDKQWSMQPYPMLAVLTGGGVPPQESLAWWQRIGLLWLGVPLALAGAFITRTGRGDAGLLVLTLGLQVAAWMWLTQLEARFLLPAAIPLALLAGRGVQGLHTAREAIPIAALRIVAGTIVSLHALAVALILSAETSLLGGVLNPRHMNLSSELPIGEPFANVFNEAASIEHPEGAVEVPPQKILLIGEARAWMYIGNVDYFTTFDSHPFARALADPKQALAWLRAQHVRYVVVNWSEMDRLRSTYGFDSTVTRESIAALEEAGAKDTQAPGSPLLKVLRID